MKENKTMKDIKTITVNSLVIPDIIETKEELMKKTNSTKKVTSKTASKSKAKAVGKGKKRCSDCGVQPIVKFGKNSALSDGLHRRCKVCEQKYRDSLKTGGTKKVAKKKVAKKTTTKKKATKKSVVKRLSKKVKNQLRKK